VSRFLRRDDDNPNAFIGIILLIVLGVFVGPNLLPEFVSDLSPYFYSGIPCARLPVAEDLAAHQSVIGRSVEDPLILEVSATDIGEDGTLTIRFTVTNASLGTVPIYYNEADVAIVTTDDNTNGFGMVVNPAPNFGLQGRQIGNLGSYPEDDIHMLGPRQRCDHSVQITASPQMITNGGTILAYYRMNTAGTQQPQSTGTRNIYPDQGLNILLTGAVFSELVEIPPRAIQ